DVEPARSTRTRVLPTQSCESAGWTGTVGVVHSHPDSQNCWYHFPGTLVGTSDAASFGMQPYAVDAIMCGDHLVWIGRDMAEQQLTLLHPRSTDASVPSGRRVAGTNGVPHGRPPLRLLRLGHTQELSAAGALGDAPAVTAHRPLGALLLRRASTTTRPPDHWAVHRAATQVRPLSQGWR